MATYNFGIHYQATMVQFVDNLLVWRCDEDGHGWLSAADVEGFLDFLDLDEGFDSDPVRDDFLALVDSVPSWYEVDDLDEDTCYVTCPDRVAEVASERQYHDDIRAEYNAATGF